MRSKRIFSRWIVEATILAKFFEALANPYAPLANRDSQCFNIARNLKFLGFSSGQIADASGLPLSDITNLQP
jgi:hypothetical protein